MRPLPVLLALLIPSVSCTDRDAPRPVPVADADARAAVPSPPADPDDPAEPGISDLARLARYVFKTMQRHDGVCPFANPYRERLHFALSVEVKAGRMARVGLGQVSVERGEGGEPRSLSAARWPRELEKYVDCLAPHLEAVTMAPAPADGSYEPAYAYGGRPDGQPAP